MDEETSQMLIGRRMRCAEDLGEAATPEETEALVRKTRTEMEAEFRAQDRWIELGRPGPNFWVWHEEMKRREEAELKLKTARVAWMLRWLLVAPFVLYPWKSKETLLEFWMWPLAVAFAMAWLDLRVWQKRVFPGLDEIIEERGCAWHLGAIGMVLAVAVGKTWWMCALIVAVVIVGCVRLSDDSGGE